MDVNVADDSVQFVLSLKNLVFKMIVGTLHRHKTSVQGVAVSLLDYELKTNLHILIPKS